MYGKVKKPSTLKNVQMVCEKDDFSSLESDCMTRMMTPEDWEKYGPVNIRDIKVMKKLKAI